MMTVNSPPLSTWNGQVISYSFKCKTKQNNAIRQEKDCSDLFGFSTNDLIISCRCFVCNGL